MFYTVVSKETVDRLFTMLFQNLSLVDPQTDIIINSLEIEDDVVKIEADVDVGTLQ